MATQGRYDDGRFFYWCWGKFQIVNFDDGMLKYSISQYDDSTYGFIGIGWGPYYFGFFKAGVKRKVKK